jgi:hypothetical protein
MAGMVGFSAALGTTAPWRADAAPASQPATQPAMLFDFRLDEPIRFRQGDRTALLIKNAAGETWMEVKEIRFHAPQPGAVTGKLTYIPMYLLGTVAVMEVSFYDTTGTLLSRADVRCPSQTGKYVIGFPVAMQLTAEFDAQYAGGPQIAKFALRLAREAEPPRTPEEEEERGGPVRSR